MKVQRKPSASIWKVYSHRQPGYCPECHGEDTLHFVSFDAEYSRSLSAVIYQCRRCEAWLDVLRPHSLHVMLKLHRLLKSNQDEEASV